MSQNTTSGVSSVTNSSIDSELSSEEMERFKQYTKQLYAFQSRVQGTVVSVDGLKGLEIVREFMIENDCPPNTGSSFTDLEDATHLEELSAIREEKAELRVSCVCVCVCVRVRVCVCMLCVVCVFVSSLNSFAIVLIMIPLEYHPYTYAYIHTFHTCTHMYITVCIYQMLSLSFS